MGAVYSTKEDWFNGCLETVSEEFDYPGILSLPAMIEDVRARQQKLIDKYC